MSSKCLVAREVAQEQGSAARLLLRRLSLAFRALAANVERERAKRAQTAAAVQHCAAQLQNRALLAWAGAVQARRGFEQQLMTVRQSMQVHG